MVFAIMAKHLRAVPSTAAGMATVVMQATVMQAVVKNSCLHAMNSGAQICVAVIGFAMGQRML